VLGALSRARAGACAAAHHGLKPVATRTGSRRLAQDRACKPLPGLSSLTIPGGGRTTRAAGRQPGTGAWWVQNDRCEIAKRLVKRRGIEVWSLKAPKGMNLGRVNPPVGVVSDACSWGKWNGIRK
jgi:hypothetical protein